MKTAAALWALTRPKGAVWIGIVPLIGYGWAHWDRALLARNVDAIALVVVAWWLLNAGTMWLNAGLDQDQGEVLFGDAVEVPAGVQWYAYPVLVACVTLAWIADPLAGAAAVGCATMAVLYSHPKIALKGHPVGGPAVNVIGYGLLSPMAGWAVVDVAVNPRTLLAWGLAAVGVLGCYFVAQAFQEEEDRSRGYRTLVATHGPQVTLMAARWCYGIGFVVCTVVALAGWVPRVCLVCVPLGFWLDHWLWRWQSQTDRADVQWANTFVSRLLVSGVLIVVVTTGQYFYDSAHGLPVAGMGTAAGHPTDRPILSPNRMRAWEARMRVHDNISKVAVGDES